MVHSDAPELNDLLAQIYRKKERPICLCKAPGMEMYVAKIGGRYVLKRMPNTGPKHTPSCNSYEPPPELSGLGQVMGAILENPDEGTISLKLHFALLKIGNRSAPIPSGVEHDSVKVDSNKLTLRGMLHYLWEEAGFNKWTPQMEGKRNWHTIRKYLLQAAENKQIKGNSLKSLLYIPEKFLVEEKDAIQGRRMAQIMQFAPVEKNSRKLMIVIGEFKDFGAARYGQKLILKHSPDYYFYMNEVTYTRINKLFSNDFQLTDSNDNHLITMATFSVNASGFADLEEIAFMPVDQNWIPIETMLDKMLLDKLYAQKRKFIRCMRYNLKSSMPLATAILSDVSQGPVAMYIIAQSASTDYVENFDNLIQGSELRSWRWDVTSGNMPNLPER